MNVLKKILEGIIDDLKEEGIIIDDEIGHRAVEIIRSHMNEVDDDWIPVEDRLPEEYESMFAKYKGTNKWSNAMWEKKSGEVNITYELWDGTRKSGTSYTIDGKWECENENRFVKWKVIAWQPLPQPYKPKKTIPVAGHKMVKEVCEELQEE